MDRTIFFERLGHKQKRNFYVLSINACSLLIRKAISSESDEQREHVHHTAVPRKKKIAKADSDAVIDEMILIIKKE